MFLMCLVKLRKAVTALDLPNLDSVNWSSFVSSAPTHKRVKQLVEECRQARFSLATQETVELVENICSMHLGVKWRKAFQSVVNGKESDQTNKVLSS